MYTMHCLPFPPATLVLVVSTSVANYVPLTFPMATSLVVASMPIALAIASFLNYVPTFVVLFVVVAATTTTTPFFEEVVELPNFDPFFGICIVDVVVPICVAASSTTLNASSFLFISQGFLALFLLHNSSYHVSFLCWSSSKVFLLMIFVAFYLLKSLSIHHDALVFLFICFICMCWLPHAFG